MQWLCRAVILVICTTLFGCDYAHELNKDDPVGAKYIGKSYCTKTPLFIWISDFERSYPEYQTYYLTMPYLNEQTLEEHKDMASKRYGGIRGEHRFLPAGARLSIERMIYIGNAVYETSGYVPLATINGELYEGEYLNIALTFTPSLAAKSLAMSSVPKKDHVEEC